jgi:hypothetical protein
VRVALFIQHLTRMRHTVASFVTPLASPRFLLYPLEGTIFRKKVTEHKICVMIFSTILFKTFITLRKNQRDIVINVETSSSKVPLFLSNFNETWFSSTDCGKRPEYKMSSKSVQWDMGCSMRTDRRT